MASFSIWVQLMTKIHHVNLFTVPLFNTIVDEDTTELKQCQYVIESAQSRKRKEYSEKINHKKTFRVLESFPKTKQILLNYSRKVLNNMMSYMADFDITTSWITKTQSGHSCQVHNHKNSFFSGIYYFDEYDDNSALVQFQNPLRELSSYAIIVDDKNATNRDTLVASIKPEKNLLLLFPSYLDHNITKQISKYDRFSLAFNIVPVGEYGFSDSTYNTSWFGM